MAHTSGTKRRLFEEYEEVSSVNHAAIVGSLSPIKSSASGTTLMGDFLATMLGYDLLPLNQNHRKN